ncbi:MAG: toll/interleukin-1 receptor domain-containing protein, partial [Acidobacteria bacterium]|nr:toll/interleukin-1 receptor domain-containing protein [Acidobacteriota bacterium]
MPLEFSSYISYPHGNGIIKDFVEELRHHLTKRIESYISLKPFYDDERLGPGYRFNDMLSRSLCRSISMIVVYVPEYESRPYCLRELAAMEALQRRRLSLIGPHLEIPQGMIFPIVLRALETGAGELKLPSWITDQSQYSDFSRFQMGYGDIFESRDVILEIEKIGKA